MSFFGNLWNGVKKIGSSVGSWFSKKKSSASNYDWTNLVSGVAGLGSSALNYASTSKGLKEQFKYNSALQANAQNWATKMASTAHQLEVTDMRKAGLNPILSATGGSGASAPSATGGSVGLPDYDLSSGLSTALQYRQQRNQDKSTYYDNELKKAQKGLVNEQENNAFQEGLNLFDTRDYIRKQKDDLENQIKNRDAITAAQVERYETMNEVDRANVAINKMVGSANSLKTRLEALGISYDNTERSNKSLFFGSNIGKRMQIADEFLKLIPLVGRYGTR